MAPLFDFSSTSQPGAKTHVSIGSLPSHIDPSQPPTKKSPWRQINYVPFIRSVTMIMPEEMYQLIWEELQAERGKEAKKVVRYAKVVMKLGEVLEGDFFTTFIKRGNVLMLSEGRPGVENVFSLQDGVLRLELDEETYKKSGLQGQPVPSGGRKHTRSRYLIELDLRQPSMLHGKKGFERIAWAAKNVLNHSVLWLFHDLEDSGLDKETSPITKHHPTWISLTPTISSRKNILVPTGITRPMNPKYLHLATEEESLRELPEYLDLVTLNAPQTNITHNIDPYLSRYSVPTPTVTTSPTSTKSPSSTTSNCNLRVIRWHGLLGAAWMKDLVIQVVRRSRIENSEHWMALVVVAHRTRAVGEYNGYTVILTGKDEEHKEIGFGEMEDVDGMEIDTLPDQAVDNALSQSRETTTTTTTIVATGKSGKGLHRFTCFEFVDAVTQ